MLPAKTDYPVIRSQLQAIGTRIKAQSNFQQTDSVQGIDRRRLPYGGRVCLRMPRILLAVNILRLPVEVEIETPIKGHSA